MTNDETIVAIYDSATHADAAVRDLEAANVPSSAITREPSATGATTTATATTTSTAGTRREPGFWSSLFGGEPDHDTAVYDRSVEAGSHVVSVRVPEAQVTRVTEILERHNPIDIDERAETYGLTGATAAAGDMAGAVTGRERLGTTSGVAAGARTGLAGEEERLQLAEEQLQVGKRAVNRGTTRIRRFVVETPVEENVTLHSERVDVERRPVTGTVPVTDADFTERTIEATEVDEEAVIAKTARVREEVVIRKDVADRTETVRDTVRRQDVEITKDGGTRTETSTGTVTPPERARI